MKNVAWVASLCVAAAAVAEDPAVPKAAPPAVGYGQVVVKDDKVVLALRQLDMIPITELRTVTTTVTQQRATADGKVETVEVPVTKTVPVMALKPGKWRTVHLPLDAKGLSVTTVAGEAVLSLKLAEKLAKETPVLVAVGEAPDAVYLKTTNPDAILVVAPASLLGQGEIPVALEPPPSGLRPVMLRPAIAPLPVAPIAAPPAVVPPPPPKPLPK